jgi:DNA-binding NarL/FixJ family response regulator
MLVAWRRLLRSSCEVVGSVSSGSAVLPAAVELEPDVIVLDVTLPDLTGLEICRCVKQSLPQIGVVLLSADDDLEMRAAAVAAGASSFLPKYSSMSSLVLAIRRAVASPAHLRGSDLSASPPGLR